MTHVRVVAQPLETALPDLARYDAIGLDTETTGTTWADAPVGLSWATRDGRRGYLPWAHDGGGNTVTLDAVRDWAARELTRPGQLKVFFNAPFDWRMMNAVGIPLAGQVEDAATSCALLNEEEPSFSLDALMAKYLGVGKTDDELNAWCAATFGGRPTRRGQAKNYWRAPADRVAEYAADDARGALELRDVRIPLLAADTLEAVYELETALIPILVQMNRYGVRVDVDRVEESRDRLRGELAEVNAIIAELAPGVNIRSTAQLAAIFAADGITVPMTEKGNPSITRPWLEACEHPLATAINDARTLDHYGGTFLESYLLNNADGRGLIHGEFHPLKVEYAEGRNYGTVSGRFSSGGALNLQNLPGDRHPEIGEMIRGHFIPYVDGFDWLKADYSQIEYRYLAHYAGGLVQRLYNAQPDVDFHQMLTDLIGQPDVCNRRRTKNVNFAIVYGSGLDTAAATAGVSVDAMKEIFAVYHEKTEGCIRRVFDRASRRAAQRGYITTWGGRRRRFTSADVARARGWRVRSSERHVGTHKALNALLQGSAADLIKMAMVRVAGIVDWENTFLHLTVHDELDFSVPPGDDGARFRRRLREVMEDDWPGMRVPVRVDIATGPDWGHTTKVPRADLLAAPAAG